MCFRAAEGEGFSAKVIGSRPGLPNACAGSETVESFGVYMPYPADTEVDMSIRGGRGEVEGGEVDDADCGGEGSVD